MKLKIDRTLLKYVYIVVLATILYVIYRLISNFEYILGALIGALSGFLAVLAPFCNRQYKRYQKRAYFGYHFGTYFSRPFSMVFRFSMRQLGPSSVNISH